MNPQDLAEMLKVEIEKIERSKKDKNPMAKIITVHLSADIFLKLAYLYVGHFSK